MRKLVLVAFLFSYYCFAQVQKKVGDNAYTINSSAVFEVESTTKGLLLPRMTTAQRDAITSPAEGLVIYNTTTKRLETNLGSAATPIWTVSGGSVSTWTLSVGYAKNELVVYTDGQVYRANASIPANTAWAIGTTGATWAAVINSAAKATNLIGGNNTTLLGAIPYQSNTDVTTLLAPNTTTTKKVLTQTGTGTNGAAPVWETAITPKVTLQTSSTTKPTSPNAADVLLVTSDGTATGLVKEVWNYTGTDWVKTQGTDDVSGAILDNTIANPATITTAGRYIVPASGVSGVFVGNENKFADFDGSSWTLFITPTDAATVIITTGTNTGQTWKYTAANPTKWAQVVSSAISIYPWVLSGAYTAGTVVNYQGNLYQANGNITANTAFTVGTTGATWAAYLKIDDKYAVPTTPVVVATGQSVQTAIANLQGQVNDKKTLYADDGTMSANRTVSQADKTLAFTSTATTGTSHFTIDGSTFNVDAVTNRVGIGIANPSTALDVNGQIKISGGNPGLGKILTSDINGLASWQTPPSNTVPLRENAGQLQAYVGGSWVALSTAAAAAYAGQNANTGNATLTNMGGVTGVLLKYNTAGTSTFTPPTGVTNVRILVVGGGQGGAQACMSNNGGDGGEVIEIANQSVTPGTSYTITVGAGGAKNYGIGGNSTFASITARGGHVGNPYSSGTGYASGQNLVGAGGASYTANGSNATSSVGGNGAIGTLSNITGSSIGYGGGGGGGGTVSISSSGSGSYGGGNGGDIPTGRYGAPGTANTGGGGGGGQHYSGVQCYDGGVGGSGTVIIFYNYVQ
jgi:roadblock/LC7 domain-containing protein